jgi:hypothetical protein
MKRRVSYPSMRKHYVFVANPLDSSEPGSAAYEHSRVLMMTRVRKRDALLRCCDIPDGFRRTRRASSEEYLLIYGGLIFCCFVVSWAARLDTLCTFGLFPFI